MIYPTLFFVAFIFAMNLTGMHYWGSSSWWQGIVAGSALGLIWHANMRIARLLVSLGIPLLIAVALGLGSALANDARGFFNGMSLGLLVGFALSAWWRWEKFKPWLVRVATIENVQWLLRMLGVQR